MDLLSPSVILVDKDKTVSKIVIDYHINAAQELIYEHYDKFNLREEMNKTGESNYLKIISNKYNILVILCLYKYMIINIPNSINNYQINALNNINSVINNYYVNEKIKINLLCHYNNDYYKNIDDVLKKIRGEEYGKVRTK